MTITNASLFGHQLPLLTYSFSSKGFPNLVEQFSVYSSFIPHAYLVSLYDYSYYLHSENIINSSDHRIRIWDSGGYEIGQFDDISTVKPTTPGNKTWNEQLYVEAANSIPWNNKDILVSYDDFNSDLDIQGQLERAFRLFDQINGNYLADVLIHIKSPVEPKELAQALVPFIDQIQILGFTEKEIAPTWIDGVMFISKFRDELNSLGIGDKLLIHIFGCFDPKTIIYFSLAGARIFDGLTWLRYVFFHRNTLYRREFEYLVSPEQWQGSEIAHSIVAHNIQEMQRLWSDISYSLITNDLENFQDEHQNIMNLTARE